MVGGLKRALHRNIVADPVLHGRVLNLYLNGEQYPNRVAGYFPQVAAEEPELAQRLCTHLREEDKHVALYTKAIRELGQPLRVLPLEDVYNSVILRNTPQPETAGDPDGRKLRLAHFFAHLHFLESRVAQSLGYHLEACARAASPYPEKAVEVILRDEQRHAAYTREAVFALVPKPVAERVLEVHRRSEGRANREFSARELKRLLAEEGHRFGLLGPIYRGCAEVMQKGAVHG